MNANLTSPYLGSLLEMQQALGRDACSDLAMLAALLPPAERKHLVGQAATVADMLESYVGRLRALGAELATSGVNGNGRAAVEADSPETADASGANMSPGRATPSGRLVTVEDAIDYPYQPARGREPHKRSNTPRITLALAAGLQNPRAIRAALKLKLTHTDYAWLKLEHREGQEALVYKNGKNGSRELTAAGWGFVDELLDELAIIRRS